MARTHSSLRCLSNTQDPSGGNTQTAAVPERNQIDARFTWRLTDLYPDVAAWQADRAEADDAVRRLAELKGTIAGGAAELLAALRLRDESAVKIERLFAYAMLLRDQDTRESEPQALHDMVGTLAVRYGEATAWFEPELLAIPEEKVRSWLSENSDLAVYEHHLDDVIRKRPHVLSAREEELLAMGGKVMAAPQQAYTMLANADMTFPTIKDSDGNDLELSEGRFSTLMQSTDRDLRKRAFFGLVETYLNYKNTMASTLAGAIQRDVYWARTHNHASSLEAALHPDAVPVEVYDNLIATIRDNLPTLHRYVDLRRRRLGLDKVHAYDMFVPLIEEEAPRIGYEDAARTIQEGLRPLGSEYAEPLGKAFDDHWIDVYETRGKRSGAYNLGTYSCHPYVLLNYDDTYRDMFTVAHELGHAMHTWFTQHKQPEIYGDYPIFLAEVASTANEIILGEHLRKKATEQAERLYLVNLAIEELRGTVITQTMFAEFEKIVHADAEAGEPLTFETLSNVYRRLVTDYYGPAYAHDDIVDGYWVRIPHFYRGFYVYKYATSYCAAAALAGSVLSGQNGALEGYLTFLKSGCSDYPLNILNRAGVDMSEPRPIADTMALFARLLDELEELLG